MRVTGYTRLQKWELVYQPGDGQFEGDVEVSLIVVHTDPQGAGQAEVTDFYLGQTGGGNIM